MTSEPVERRGLGFEPTGRRRTAHEYVREALRAEILSGRLPGGARLVQTEIARDLGVSTTPVREAMRDLATQGLVRLDAHRGGTVHRLTYEDLHEIHELCRLVEPEAMRRLAVIVGDDVLTAARALADQMGAERDPVRWTELNRTFHATLLDAIPSTRLRQLLRGLRDSAAPYVAQAIRNRGPRQFTAANAQHSQILDALAARDGDRCADLTRRHVNLTLEAIDESRDRFATDDD